MNIVRELVARTGGSILLLGFLALLPARLPAAQLQEAQVTRIINQVDLLSSESQARAAVMNDNVRHGTAVRTGTESRAELTFTDQTLTRIGENTLFSFNEGTRNMNLGGGVMLVHVPKNAGGATINTAGVTAGVTGTTIMLEYHKDAYTKLIVMEGNAWFALKKYPRQIVVVHAGEMVMVAPNATSVGEPVAINLARLMETSLLVRDFAPLASAGLISHEIALQQDRREKGQLRDPAAGVDPVDPPPLDTLDEHIAALLPVGPGLPGAPAEFGPLNLISTPNPYVLGSGTTIMTAPTITTAGVTDQGKLYRGQAVDGDPSVYLFGSTSEFDAESGIDGTVEGTIGKFAAFKFQSLQVTGNPTIKVPRSGSASLVLLGIDGITVTDPGGNLTFAGLDRVMFATQGGSINFGNPVSLSGLSLVTFYARGDASSNLTVGAPITNVGTANLIAQGDIQVNGNERVNNFESYSDSHFLTGTGVISFANSATIHATNTVNFALSQFAAGPAASDLTLTSSTIAIDASTNPSFFSTVPNSTVQAGTTLNITGGTTLTFGNSVADFEAGLGGIQASGENFSGTSASVTMDAQGGPVTINSINNGAVLTAETDFTVNGDATTTDITATTGNISIGGNLTVSQTAKAGGNLTVTGNLKALDVEVAGNITAATVSVASLNADSDTSTSVLTASNGAVIPYPGRASAFTVASVQSFSTSPGINFNGNMIGTGANGGTLTINASGDQPFSSSAGINNADFNGGDAAAAGMAPGSGGRFTVNSDGTISLNAQTITATTGIIGTNDAPAGSGGNISLNGTGPVTFQNSTVQVSSADPLGQANRRASAAGGTINVTSKAGPGAVAVMIDSTSQLLSLLDSTAPGPGGLITVHVPSTSSSNSIQVNGTLRADQGGVDVRHDGDSGQIILTNATLRGDIVKVAALGSGGIVRIGGGTLDADTTLKLYAPGSNGQLVFVADCTLRGGVNNILAANTITINPSVTVTTQGHIADVYTNNANYSGFGGNNSTGGTFGGLGANNPKSLSSAPPIGSPGGP